MKLSALHVNGPIGVDVGPPHHGQEVLLEARVVQRMATELAGEIEKNVHRGEGGVVSGWFERGTGWEDDGVLQIGERARLSVFHHFRRLGVHACVALA